MKYCKYCKVLNEEEAQECKICGRKLETNKAKEKMKEKVNSKTRYKTKYRTKNKIKTKTKVKDKREKGKMNFFQKFLMFNLIIIVIVLSCIIGFLGYHIYKTENIKVPNVIGYTYEDAYITLTNKKLNAQKIEKIVEDKNKEGIVLNQNKKETAKENEIIKLTIGVLENKIKVPKVEGLTLEEAINILNKYKINYKIKYKIGDEDNIVLKENEKINSNSILTITVMKKQEEKIEEKSEESKETQIG